MDYNNPNPSTSPYRRANLIKYWLCHLGLWSCQQIELKFVKYIVSDLKIKLLYAKK